MKSFILATLFLLGIKAAAQPHPYAEVDSLMRGYQEKVRDADDLYKVVHFIRKRWTVDSLRLRAAFIWITHNISYDVKALMQDRSEEASTLKYTLKKKKTVCSGYAALLQYFCNAFGLQNERITGFARGARTSINLTQRRRLLSNHAWNAVYLNGTWRLYDPTWAAGSVDDSDPDQLRYIPEYHEGYYETPPELLIGSHLPDKNVQQFLVKPVDLYAFKDSPMKLYGYLRGWVRAVRPDTAVIRARVGDTIVFRFQTERIADFYAASDLQKKAANGAPGVVRDGWLEFHYPVTVPGYYNLFIYFAHVLHRESLVAYRLEVNGRREKE
ncbi:MAG TPA: transglutaminase domain-containing protein [Chitinophagaceae bacterium]|jgi:hypothetical protein|nr:transglutaminase domain-containing protein [Chitinophagaceae bacterium]